MSARPRALSIAGLDPTGGAGLLQDIRTFAVCEVWGMGVVAALTVQDTSGVRAWEAVGVPFVRAQIETLVADLPPAATKTGMLGTAGHAELVAQLAPGLGKLVVDPVLRASSGDALAADDLIAVIRAAVLPVASVVTPNIAEAAALTGRDVDGVPAMREAARALVALGVRAAVITGGHLDDAAIDVVLDDAGEFHELRAPRIATRDDHGTGCVFSAALAARLARGDAMIDAARAAKGVVTRALRNAERSGSGRGPVHPAAQEVPWPLAGHPFE